MIPVEPSPISSPFYSALNYIKANPKVSLVVVTSIVIVIIAVSIILALVLGKTQQAVVEEPSTEVDDLHEEVQPEGLTMWPIILGAIGFVALIISIILYMHWKGWFASKGQLSQDDISKRVFQMN
jgi:hypothetical protein